MHEIMYLHSWGLSHVHGCLSELIKIVLQQKI